MKVLDIKLHENPSSGSRANACGVIDMAKITGAFRDNANIPKKNKAFFFSHCSFEKVMMSRIRL